MRIEIREPRTYELIELIGEGGFGQVYRARKLQPPGPEVEVAIKIAEGAQALAVERIHHEAWVLSLLRHRAVVRVVELVRLPIGWALVMEHVEGVDLSEVIACEPLPLSVAAEIVVEVAGVLACAGPLRSPEGRPLLLQHRDIKPANIRLTLQGGIKLLDFGISWAVTGEGEEAAIPYGSAGYVSPERARKKEHHTSDIFALGVVFYEMLTARPLGAALADPAAHQQRVEERIRSLPAGIPPAARRLIEEMLAWRPEDRPSAREVERRASALARSAPPTLRDWSEARLPRLRAGVQGGKGAPRRRGSPTWVFTTDRSTPVLALKGSDPWASTVPRRARVRWPVSRGGRIPAGLALKLIGGAVLAALLGGLVAGAAWQSVQGMGPSMAFHPP